MPILTLTTDFGTKSFDIAALKGTLMCASSNTTIIDISHEIEAFNKLNAAYTLKNAASNFPAKTIHFTNINLKEGNNRILLVSRKSQYYVCPDNGLISMMFPDEDFKAFVLNGLDKDFSYKDINEKLCEIIRFAETNPNITELGTATTSYLRTSLVRAAILPDLIRASVIYEDKFGNAVTNVTKEMFYNFVENNQYSITTRNYRAHKISKHYTEVERGEMLCLFNDAGLLEIAINDHRATQLLGIEYGSLIIIEKI